MNAQQKTSALLMGLGLLLVCSVYFAPLFVVFLVGMAWSRPAFLSNVMMPSQGKAFWGLVAVTFLLSLLRFPELSPVLMPDDGWRHLTAYRIGFDYRNLYPHLMYLPDKSLWIGWEWWTGQLVEAWGLRTATGVLQALFVLLHAALGVAIACRTLSGELRKWVPLFLVFWFQICLIERGLMLRPESWLSLWALSAVVLPGWAWFVAGIAWMPQYWLAWIYLPAALLLNTAFRYRMLYSVLLAGVFVTFWTNWMGFAWLSAIFETREAFANRVAEVSENAPLLSQMNLPMLLILMIGVVGLSRPHVLREGAYYLNMLWFALPNQTRYFPLVMSLWLVALIRDPYLAHRPVTAQTLLALTVVGLGSLVMRPGLPNHDAAPTFDLPPGSHVLAPFNMVMFSLGANHPGITVASGMEIGAIPKDLQQAGMAAAGRGTLECDTLFAYQITDVISEGAIDPPPCLRAAEPPRRGATKDYHHWAVVSPPAP